MEALLVKGDGDHVRVILGPYCLEFEADDLLTVDELPLPRGIAEGTAIAARITLKPAARLLRLASADPYRNALWTQGVPFALATRTLAVFKAGSAMKEREEAFLAARGLKKRFS